MCGIGGFYSHRKNYTDYREHYSDVLTQMHQIQSRRGPDGHGIWLSPHAGLSHARLSIIDLTTGGQPMTRTVSEATWAIVHNGELYNTKELREELSTRGWTFHTTSDTEVILLSYLEYGPDFIKKLNGIFATAIYDPKKNRFFSTGTAAASSRSFTRSRMRNWSSPQN